MNKTTKYLANAALVAALYVALCYISSLMGLSSGVIQVRLSEILCILPALMPAAVPGLALGCFLANILTGCVIWDVIFGTLATLIGALLSYLLRKVMIKGKPYLSLLPPIISNTLIVPPILVYAYGVPEGYAFVTLTVFLGELISTGILGLIFLNVIYRNKIRELLN